MSAGRFWVDFKYALFATVFATRPAVLLVGAEQCKPGIPGSVFEKHPLGSNILKSKFTVTHRRASQLQHPPARLFWVQVRPGGVMGHQIGGEASGGPQHRHMAVLHGARAPQK